jgi:hypothetical protein
LSSLLYSTIYLNSLYVHIVVYFYLLWVQSVTYICSL